MPEARELHLHPSSRGMDPAALRAGVDLVLDIPNEHGTAVAAGVLVDDHLDAAARADIDREALHALTAWRNACDAALTVGPFSVSDVWHGELFAEVFLPVLRVARGVLAAAAASQAEAVVAHGLDPELVATLAAVLAPTTVRVASAGRVQRYPTEDAAPAANRRAAPPWRRVTRAALGATGIPSALRGRILVVSYYSTQPVLEVLATGRGPAPVLYAPIPPPLPIAARAAVRGGWSGLPGAWHRRRAQRQLQSLLLAAEAVEPFGVTDAPLGPLLHRRALRCLGDRASLSLALGVLLDRALSRGRLDAVITPFDGEPLVKVLVRVAQAHGVPVLTIQHGYEPRKLFAAGNVSDAIGQWSHWDLAALPAERRDRARVVGNPGRGALRPTTRRRADPPRAVVLVEHSMRFTAALDRRVVAEHLGIALRGVAGSRYDWRVTVRPHPADDAPAFAALAERLSGTRVEVDPTTPILDLLAEAQVCIGAFSTAALQTALVDTPMVMLTPQTIDCVPPLDGSGGVRLVHDAEGLSQALDEIHDQPVAPGRDDLLAALGFGPADPIAAVLAWADELRAGHHRRRPVEPAG